MVARLPFSDRELEQSGLQQHQIRRIKELSGCERPWHPSELAEMQQLCRLVWGAN
jgi:hypothetical protein